MSCHSEVRAPQCAEVRCTDAKADAAWEAFAMSVACRTDPYIDAERTAQKEWSRLRALGSVQSRKRW